MVSNTVGQYYDAWESRLGYKLLLGGTRHFGYYDHDKLWPFSLSSAMRAMEQRMFDILSLPTGSRVLDAGCGVGHVAMFMAKLGLKVEAIDLLDRHISRARKNIAAEGLEREVQAKRMSFQELDFENDSFDGLYTMETLSHSPDLRVAIAEFYRVLKPGGRFALFEYEHDPLDSGPMGKAITYVNEIASMPTFQACTRGTHKKALEAAGFENVEVRDYSKNISPMMRFFAAFAWLPYLILGILGLRSKFPNAAAAVELWRYREHIQYVAISGQKPVSD